MKKRHIYLILCFLWMVIIFWFSHQPADDSQGMSNSIIELIDQLFHVNIMAQGGWLFDTFSFLVRKAAHMSEYALMAILYALCMKEYGIKRYGIWAIAAVFLYACSDEFHQLFITGRSGQFTDVLIDTAGGCFGVLILYGFFVLKEHFYRKRCSVND